MRKTTISLVIVACLLTVLAGRARSAPAEEARQILKAAGVRGGLVVHVGCGSAQPGELTAALRAGDAYVVHGLDTDPATVEAARATIRSLGLYGPVSVDRFDGRRLPYIDNLVNLVVAEDLGDMPMSEVMRVLAPHGVAYVKSGGAWTKTVKPRPAQIDEWTHFLHGPSGNAVADDRVVGPPRGMQWLARPTWTRHHHSDKGTQPAIRGLVSAGGRLFYLVDEATAAHIRVPSRWRLMARDAFSGVTLWRKPLPVREFPRRLEQLWRFLVADGDRLYAPLGPGRPISALDAATGEVLRTYPETEGVEEVIKAGGTLLVVVGDTGIVAVQADTGRRLWTWAPPEGVAIVPLTLAASDGKVFVKTDRSVCGLSAETGDRLWRFVPEVAGKRKRLRWPRARLIAAAGVVLCSYGGKDPAVLNRDRWQYLGSHPRVNEYGGRLAALSADDGRLLWETAYRPGLESYPGDLFVIGGLVWLGPDYAEARDLHTGEVKRRQDVLERLWTTGHHHRCYPEKATSRYILTGKRGVEMIDLAGENHSRNNWVRGTCRLGVTPCNGLLYAPPHSCGCYMEAKLYGFWALAPVGARGPPGPEVDRLQEGPAYGSESANRPSEVAGPEPGATAAGAPIRHPARRGGPTSDVQPSDDWPTYRHDPMRSGSTASAVPADLALLWRAAVGSRVTPPVVAAGRVLVADVDAHRILCLDAATGKTQWTFTAGGRVDSPPTVYGGRVLAGCADGSVYALRLSDGALAWRFLAAPSPVNAVAMDQVESLWPVHGSVLVTGGVAYAAAGRSSYLDGGIVLYGLDPATGKVVCAQRVCSEHPSTPPPPPEAKRQAMRAKVAQNDTDFKTFTAPDHSDAFS
ncbi:MAG: PQQ-binding-like beta-propeller repeat protein, partial [Planctomycetota bacterium]|nr:PQQ-binding-like beta-propeller repeat protein [Planctomycetota bacterium]